MAILNFKNKSIEIKESYDQVCSILEYTSRRFIEFTTVFDSGFNDKIIYEKELFNVNKIISVQNDKRT